MYCIKRTYNRHGEHDYLIARDPKWLTACAGYRSPSIIQYADKAAAEAVIAEIAPAYAAKYPARASDKFAAVPFPPSN